MAVAGEIHAVGYSAREAAQLLRVTGRTLRQWRHDLRPLTAPTPLPGRPLRRSSSTSRNAVIEYLDAVGPGVGLPPLRTAFPTLSRAELDDLLTRYRRVWRRRHLQPLHVLEWTTPGRVWAMDFAEAPACLDSIGAYLLAVRDLASGRQLLWQPVRAANAAEVVEALSLLFVACGAPLVLKHDNGSPFTAAGVAQLLAGFHVVALVSPPYMPRYNGSIEAGIGALKGRTAAHAARHGRIHTWTYDDLAAARAEANAYARPRGASGPTPDESWAARTSLTPEERVSFAHAVEVQRCIANDEPPPNSDDGSAAARATDRTAIRRALVEHGYLRFTRRLIPPPIPRRKAEDVS